MQLATLTHVSTTTDAEGGSVLSFTAVRPFDHKAGQFGVWFCGGALRPFTIASAPRDEFVQLGTHLHNGSAIKRGLTALRPGDRVRLLGAFGKVAPPEDGRPIVFVAQGIGITVARSLLREPSTRPRHLIHTGRPYFQDELAPLVETATYPPDRDAFTTALNASLRATPDAHWVITGSPAFVKSTASKLRSNGVDAMRLHTDGFLGLPDRD